MPHHGPWKHSEERERNSTAAERRAQARAQRENDHRQVARELELLRPWLGDEVDTIKARARIPDRDAVSRALIRAGKSGRGHAIRRCASRVVTASAMPDGSDARAEGLAPRYCRDRLCPGCASRRAVRIGIELARRLESQDADRMVFATLTQPRIKGEPLACARKRHAESWAALSRSSQWARKHWGAMVEGGVRAYETTWDHRKGWHWHSHSVLQFREDIDRGAASGMILRRWLEVCKGASASAQLIVPVDAARIWQLAKYPVKPLESKGVLSPKVTRELILGTRGARMIQPLGSWGALVKGLDDDDDDEEDGGRVWLSGDHVRSALDAVERHGADVEIECASREGDVRTRVRWSDVIESTRARAAESAALVAAARAARD